MNLYKSKKFQLSFLYLLFLMVSVSEFKFIFSSSIPVFITGVFGLFFFYKNFNLSNNEKLIFSFFGIYASIYFFFFTDAIVFLKSFKYYFGWIFFILLFRLLRVNINIKYCLYFLFFLFLVEFLLVNILSVNYSSIYTGVSPLFRFFDDYFRMSGFTGNSSMTTTIFSALYLNLIFNNKDKLYDFFLYTIVIFLSFSFLGFIFLSIILFTIFYRSKFFNQKNVMLISSFIIMVCFLNFNNFNFSLGNKYRSGPTEYLKIIIDVKVAQFKRHVVKMSLEDQEFSQVNNFFYDWFKYGDWKANYSIEYIGHIFDERRDPSLKNKIYLIDSPRTSELDILFGIQRKMNIFQTGGDFAFLSQIISLGFFSIFMMLMILKQYKLHLNFPAIILVLSCFHYPTLMHVSGQFFLAVLLNSNQIKKYD